MHHARGGFPIVSILFSLLLAVSAPIASAASLTYVNSALWSGLNEVVCRDTLVYAAYQYGLRVINIADPATPKPVSQLYLTPGGFIGIAVQGNYAFLAAGGSGVAVVDISEPANPRLVTWRDTPGSASALAVQGNYLYVTDTWEGLQVIDISDPEHPQIEGSYDTPGDARGIALYGDFVLIADGYDGGLQVVNVALPEIPYPAGQFNTSGIAKRVVVSGHYAYVADADGGLVTIDITDPTQPQEESVYPESPAHGYTEDLAVRNGIVYCVVAGYLRVIDCSDPESPHAIDTLNEAGYGNRVMVSGDRLFMLYPQSGMSIFGIAAPAAPVLLGRYKAPGEINRIAVQDDVLAVGCDDGLHLFDVTTPVSPVEISSVPAMIACRGVAIADGYAYFADADSGTHVIDISNPTQPIELNRFNSTGTDWEVSTNGGYLSVSGYGAGTSFYALDDPVHPTLIGTYLASYFAHAACDGHHGYIPAGVGGFQVVNLTDSMAPFREGRLQVNGSFGDVALDSPYAYLAHSSAGLIVADISDPSKPREIGRFNGFPGNPNSAGLALSGKVVFLAVDDLGVWAIDVSNPSGPVPMAMCPTAGTATRATVSGDYVYVADLFGMVVLKFNQPTDVQDGDTENIPHDITLAQNYPNPFNPRTTISFTLPGRDQVRLTIYNLLGQEVSRLVDGVLAAGSHSVEWNGVDRHGRPVASGVYLYKLSVGKTTASRKMILLK